MFYTSCKTSSLDCVFLVHHVDIYFIMMFLYAILLYIFTSSAENENLNIIYQNIS